jgi:hypothetical protein
MSSQSSSITGNQAIIHTDVSKIFLRDNRYQKGNETGNAGYDPLELVAGTVMGRVAATGKLVPCASSATDGSQYPVGILAHDVEIDIGETKEVTIVDMGDVAEDKVDFYYNGDTLDTQLSSRRMRDWLQAQGIKLITLTEMTDEDND